jgi:hypothetical protein
LVIMHQKCQNSTHMLALVLFSEHLRHPSRTNIFVVEMLRNNFMDQWARNLKKFLMNFIKSEMPVYPNVLINPVFQVLSDKGQAPGLLLIVNACPTFVRHLTHFIYSLHLPHTLQ